MERYRRQFLNFGDVKPEVIGRSLNSVSMHPHLEFQIMVAVLKHPEKTLAEIAHDLSNKKSVYFGRPFNLT